MRSRFITLLMSLSLAAVGCSFGADDASLCATEVPEWSEQVTELREFGTDLLGVDEHGVYETLAEETVGTTDELRDQVEDDELSSALDEAATAISAMSQSARGATESELLISQGPVLDSEIAVLSRCYELTD